MTLPDPPDLGRPPVGDWRLTALCRSPVVGRADPGISRCARADAWSLGDTDDAMRAGVGAGAFLNGQGWWSQHLFRLQPPIGVYMHWSRLLDGGIAAMTWSGFSPFSWVGAKAEWLTRLVWPLLWIFPGAVAAYWL